MVTHGVYVDGKPLAMDDPSASLVAASEVDFKKHFEAEDMLLLAQASNVKALTICLPAASGSSWRMAAEGGGVKVVTLSASLTSLTLHSGGTHGLTKYVRLPEGGLPLVKTLRVMYVTILDSEDIDWLGSLLQACPNSEEVVVTNIQLEVCPSLKAHGKWCCVSGIFPGVVTTFITLHIGMYEAALQAINFDCPF